MRRSGWDGREDAALTAYLARFMGVARAMVEAAGIDDAEERSRWLADYSDGVLLHQLTARHYEPVDVESHRRAIRRLLLD